MAAVENVTVIPEKTSEGSEGFSILDSHMNPGSTLISPDISHMPRVRKGALYPVGPPDTAIPLSTVPTAGQDTRSSESLPYDRSRTVMKDFRMCAPCKGRVQRYP